MRWWGKLIVAAAVAGVAVQFVRPRIGNPPVTAELQAPEAVKAILHKSCYNCHSNETQLKWFDQPVPAYWLVAYDVRRARRRVNFSEIGKLPAGAQRAALYEAVNMVRLGAMPLPQYRLAHPESAVTTEEMAVLEAYLDPFPAPVMGMSGAAPVMAAAATDLSHVPDELNGLAFFPDYKSWKPISATDRGDNGTLRVILGNDAAVKAIAEKKVMPWPDGAAFAKIAWQAVPDANGVLQAGKFLQVEFMVKDAAKHKSTAGWGWGRWRGMDLKPYGANAHFTEECVGCHLPVKGNDFVYSLPVERGGQ
jgi:heme-binding protein/cytochrome P460